MSFEADFLTHLRRRLQRILKAAPDWTEFDPADVIVTLLFLPRCAKLTVTREGQFGSPIRPENSLAKRQTLYDLSPAK